MAHALTHGALCNGIGGFALAARKAGIRTIWTCETDPFCNAVSRRHFPSAHQYGTSTMSTTRPVPTLFPPATLASQLAWPGTAQARQMTAGSGRKCCALLSSAGPAGSLVKMLLATSRWASTACFLTWKPQAMKSGRLLFRLAPSTPRTAATGSGLLPTPTTTDAGTGRINRSPSPNAPPRPTLALYFKRLPTPIANDAANPQAYP